MNFMNYKRDYDKFVRKLEKQGIKLADIKYIFLTHHHDDHTGLVVHISGQCGAHVFASEKGVEPLKKGGMSTFPPVTLGDGDVIISGDDDRLLRSIGVDGKILSTPRHTKDSVSILLDDGIYPVHGKPISAESLKTYLARF